MFQLRDQLGDQHASLKSCEIYVFVILLLRGYVYWISTGTIASRRNGHTTSLHVSVGPKIWILGHMRTDGCLSYSKPFQLLLQVLDVVWGGISVLPLAHVGLQVDVVPGHNVVLGGGEGPADGEEQPLLPGQVEPVQGLQALRAVWEVGHSREVRGAILSTRVWVFRALCAMCEPEGNLNCVVGWVAGQRTIQDRVGDCAGQGPVTGHSTVHLFASWTLKKWTWTVFQQTLQARLVVSMIAEVEAEGPDGVRVDVVVRGVPQLSQADRAVVHTGSRPRKVPGDRVLREDLAVLPPNNNLP